MANRTRDVPERKTNSDGGVVVHALTTDGKQLSEDKLRELQRYIDENFYGKSRQEAVTPEYIKEQRRLGWPDIHPEDYCHECGRPNICWFAQNDLWNQVMDDRGSIVCPICFVNKAEEQGIKPPTEGAWELVCR